MLWIEDCFQKRDQQGKSGILIGLKMDFVTQVVLKHIGLICPILLNHIRAVHDR